jgi:DNA-binding FadR family transcriptional regulator
VTDLKFQRRAELVADDLRDRILRGDLADGEVLPKLEELRQQYPMSLPSLREAMRILEVEGLVQVRRGNVGGALVRRPSATNVASTVAMVLAAERVDVDDVREAVRELESSSTARSARADTAGSRTRAVMLGALAAVLAATDADATTIDPRPLRDAARRP